MVVNFFKKTVKTPEYHTSIRTLPVWNFYEVLNTGDTKHLYVKEAGEEDLSEVWKEIYNEYCKAAKIDNRHLKQYAKIDSLIFRYKKLATCLAFLPKMNEANKKEAIEWLKSENYLIDLSKDFLPQYERCRKQLGSLHTKIQIEQDKLPKEDKKEAVSLMKQVIAIENMFPGRVIDIYTMPVEKWLALQEHASETVKLRKNVTRQY